MKDLISIIVPIYRVEKYLEQCIQSIRNQTYRNLEIILVNDGSDDQCPQICEQYARIDKRIKVVHKKNGGLDSARKVGIEIAGGKYIGYVDGDDWIEPEMYEKLLRYAQIYDVDVVESGVIDTSENMQRKRAVCLEEGCYKGKEFTEKIETRLLYAGSFFEYGISPYMWSKLFLKEKLMKYQMMSGIMNEVQDDIMVSLPCIAESKKIYISHNCYYHYRVRNDSLKREVRNDEVLNLIKCYPEFYIRFKGTKLCLEGDKQIKYYIMFWLLFKAPYVYDSLCTDEFLIPFGGLKIKDKIILYGAGAAGIHLEKYIHSVEGNNMVCWVDRNYKDLQFSLDVCNPKEIISYRYDYIIISILRERDVQSAKRDLINLGIPEKKILWIKQEYIDDPDLLLNKVNYCGEKLRSKF